MIAVGPGAVTLTDRRTQTSWTVALEPYLLAATPVTEAQYAAVVGRPPGAADLPVVSVSWLDAARYCNALSERAGLAPAYALTADGAAWDTAASGYRLPTEAEWEHACRASTTGPRYGALDEIAWHRGNAGGARHAVGTRAPNAWGFHDLLGNVWEWCWDVYDAEVYGAYRVLRGGGWSDEHWSCRASVRRRSHPTFAIDDVGFRVARTPESTS
jgi:formylglycine-generating enzyme required for sulfatase activity